MSRRPTPMPVTVLFATAALAAALFASPGSAQEKPPDRTDPAVPDSATHAPSGSMLLPLGGIRYSTPLRFSGYIGIAPATFDRHLTRYGFALIAEVGTAGAQLSVGRGWLNAHMGLAYFRPQLSVMRTWGDPHAADPDETFVGMEVRLGGMLIGVGAGLFVRVSDGDGNPLVLSAGAQLGI